MLKIIKLRAKVEDQEVLKGIDLEILPGQIHAIMGPNGSGKSTLSKVLVGHPDYQVTDGEILFEGENILELDPEDRAKLGIFLGFQYPVEVSGVNNADFLRLAYNAKQVALGEPELDPFDFNELLEKKLKLLDIYNEIYTERSVNDGFSGGEKKRNEILQMAILEPKLAILDEIDSGLDIDALRAVAYGINKLVSLEKALLLITHYHRLLEHITPTHVHIMYQGKIIRSGGKELPLILEQTGYQELVSTN
ncbi:MAG: Fe-S cluster assembly ATPase SufC [Candidatus Caenarcaniphilales bacterium]|nr:Fe-S cluster assembly ATPase SufC [Candidatus Caenarcaniphilales bacterium]